MNAVLRRRLWVSSASSSALVAALLAALPPAASAQQAARSDGYSLIPGTRQGYIGLNVGRSDFGDFGCGSALFACDDTGTRTHLYTGGMFSQWLGAEIGYLNEGKANRGGGSTRAEGLNLSLIGRVPLGAFGVYGKAGTTYGRTRVSSTAGSGIIAGRERGWGGSFAAGVSYDFTPSSAVVLEWSRNSYRVPGGGRADVDGASLGYMHRF